MKFLFLSRNFNPLPVRGFFYVCRAVLSTWRLKSSHNRTQAGLCSRTQGVHCEMESEGREAKDRAEAKANQRWPSASTTRHKNGEVSYGIYGSVSLRGSVRKGTEGAGGDYGRHGGEADGMTTGDLMHSTVKEEGAEAEIEAVVSNAISRRRNAKRRCMRSQRSS